MSINIIAGTQSQTFCQWFEKNRDRVIHEVAAYAIKDACAGFAFAAVTSYFVTTRAGLVTLGILPIAVTITNLFFRTFHLFFQDEKVEIWGMKWVLPYLPALCFSVLDLTTRQVLVHEGGHYISYKLFYKCLQPTIEVFPLSGGITRCSRLQILSEWGEKLGKDQVKIARIAAGSLATTTLGLPMLTFGHYQGGQLGEYLQAFVFLTAISDAAEALMVFFSEKSSSSDFSKLERLGIHPMVSAATVFLIPLTLKGMLLLIDRLKRISTN